MNIYLHVEISKRELDSKILLAVIAAAKGHQVVISDLATIKGAIKYKALTPGIFHTKSLTPNDEKIATHQFISDNNFLITSIDEEGGLLKRGYNEFAKERYSENLVNQSSAIFCWGPEDEKTLKKIYEKFSSKIHKTGSPRADLWRSDFLEYWNEPAAIPKKPFLLISSNLYLANYIKPFHQWIGFKSIKFKKGMKYFQNDPELFKKQFYNVAEDYQKLAAFVEAIQYLSDNNNGYDIVLRPHPLENIQTWKIYLEGLKNVHVTNEGTINWWVNNSFAVMHNSCTTALEATISKKSLVTYIPFKQNYSWEIPNELGYKVETLSDLLNKINDIYKNFKNSKVNVSEFEIPKVIHEKIYFDEKELSANKIIKIWETLEDHNNFKPINIFKLKMFLKLKNLKNIFFKLLRSFSIYNSNSLTEDIKFSKLNEDDIQKRVKKLQNILGIKKNLRCEVLSKRTILIK